MNMTMYLHTCIHITKYAPFEHYYASVCRHTHPSSIHNNICQIFHKTDSKLKTCPSRKMHLGLCNKIVAIRSCIANQPQP